MQFGNCEGILANQVRKVSRIGELWTSRVRISLTFAILVLAGCASLPDFTLPNESSLDVCQSLKAYQIYPDQRVDDEFIEMEDGTTTTFITRDMLILEERNIIVRFCIGETSGVKWGWADAKEKELIGSDTLTLSFVNERSCQQQFPISVKGEYTRDSTIQLPGRSIRSYLKNAASELERPEIFQPCTQEDYLYDEDESNGGAPQTTDTPEDGND